MEFWLIPCLLDCNLKKSPRSKKVLEYALVSISALKGAWVILMSTPGPFPLKGEMFFDLCG